MYVAEPLAIIQMKIISIIILIVFSNYLLLSQKVIAVYDGDTFQLEDGIYSYEMVPPFLAQMVPLVNQK